MFEDQSYAGEALITQVLHEHEGATTLTSTVGYTSRHARDTVLTYPMERGVGESYDALDRVLANWPRARSPAG